MNLADSIRNHPSTQGLTYEELEEYIAQRATEQDPSWKTIGLPNGEPDPEVSVNGIPLNEYFQELFNDNEEYLQEESH